MSGDVPPTKMNHQALASGSGPRWALPWALGPPLGTCGALRGSGSAGASTNT